LSNGIRQLGHRSAGRTASGCDPLDDERPKKLPTLPSAPVDDLVAAGADFLDPIRSLADDLSADDEEINLRTELKSVDGEERS